MAHQTFFKHDMPSRVDAKREKVTAKEANWRKVSKQVDRRDQHRCRACRTSVNPDGLDLLDRGHRHHLEFRSKGGQDVASNLVLLCPMCHDKVHVKRTLRFEWGPHGADGPLEVWRQGADGVWFMAMRETVCGVVERD
jgi:5-methylcytosine-specific restriction endonuclease McrA